MRICGWEGCDREVPPKRGRLCNKHYAERRRRANGAPVRGSFVPRPCNWTDCNEPHKAKGYCASHYHTIYRTKSGLRRTARPAPRPRETMGVWEEGEHVTVVHWRLREEPWACPECGVKVG